MKVYSEATRAAALKFLQTLVEAGEEKAPSQGWRSRGLTFPACTVQCPYDEVVTHIFRAFVIRTEINRLHSLPWDSRHQPSCAVRS